jgi:hypothetical protein
VAGRIDELAVRVAALEAERDADMARHAKSAARSRKPSMRCKSDRHRP